MFRIDRLELCETTGEMLTPEPGKTLRDYLHRVAADGAGEAETNE